VVGQRTVPDGDAHPAQPTAHLGSHCGQDGQQHQTAQVGQACCQDGVVDPLTELAVDAGLNGHR
jgi:hypothetical protein